MYGYEWRNTNVSGNAFDRWFYVSFLSVSCFCKNQKNETNIEEAKKKLNVFLICTMPVPIIAIVLILIGLKALM